MCSLFVKQIYTACCIPTARQLLIHFLQSGQFRIFESLCHKCSLGRGTRSPQWYLDLSVISHLCKELRLPGEHARGLLKLTKPSLIIELSWAEGFVKGLTVTVAFWNALLPEPLVFGSSIAVSRGDSVTVNLYTDPRLRMRSSKWSAILSVKPMISDCDFFVFYL